MQSPSCSSRSLNVSVICKAPPKHVPEPPAPFIGHASPSNTPGMSSNADVENNSCFEFVRHYLLFENNSAFRIHRLTPALAPTQSALATQLPTAKKAARAKNAPPPTQSTHAISTHLLRGKPMATIPENSTTVEGVSIGKPPGVPLGLRSEGLTKASSLDQPREDAYAKQAPTPPRAELQPQT